MNGPMRVRDLIAELHKHPMEMKIYIGKGMGPLARISESESGQIWIVLSPENGADK